MIDDKPQTSMHSSPLDGVVRVCWWPLRVIRRIALWVGRLARNIYSAPAPMRVLFDSAELALLEKNKDTFRKYAGRRCFILGNGPSFGAVDLAALRDDITIAVNRFVDHPMARQYNPTYYFLSGDIWFDGSPASAEFLDSVKAATPASDYFVRLMHAKNILRYNALPLERTHFIPIRGVFSDDGVQIKTVDFQQPVPCGVNSLLDAVLVAMHLGCSPIYLLGAEHDWLATKDEYRHFYSTPTVLPKDFKLITEFSYYEKIVFSERVWKGHINLRKCAERMGFQIVNLTPGSYLDVYEQKELKTVLSG